MICFFFSSFSHSYKLRKYIMWIQYRLGWGCCISKFHKLSLPPTTLLSPKMASTFFTVPMATTTLSSSIPSFLKFHTPFRSLRFPTPTFFNRKFTTLAVATRPSQPPAAVSDSDQQNKIVLPTNDSSHTLLRIRHTVLYYFQFTFLSFILCCWSFLYIAI
jgi:hypothetical protein